jgi:hypothetical protein
VSRKYNEHALTAFERSLKVNDEVLARWTAQYCSYSVPAVVVDLDPGKVVVAVLRDVHSPRTGELCWPAGSRITLPTLSGLGEGWSPANGCFPPLRRKLTREVDTQSEAL